MKLKELFNDAKVAPKGGFLEERKEEAVQGESAVASSENKETILSASSKLEKILEAVEGVSSRQKYSDAQPADASDTETVADDVMLPEEVQAKIHSDEGVVRAALALLGHDYDALIKMDETSVYGRAVAANPQILDRVAASENPVLEALSVAVSVKPYVDFMETYGDSPEKIKAAITAEALGEKQKAANAKVDADEPSALASVLPFSYGGASEKKGDAPGKNMSAVEGVFG